METQSICSVSHFGSKHVAQRKHIIFIIILQYSNLPKITAVSIQTLIAQNMKTWEFLFIGNACSMHKTQHLECSVYRVYIGCL